MGWSKVSCVHVDLHQKGVDMWAKTHSRIEEYLEERSRSLMLHMNSVFARLSIRKHNYRARRKSDEQGIGLRNLYPVCATMVPVMAHRANTDEANTGKGFSNQKVRRSRGQNDCKDDFQTFWRCAHSENVHFILRG